MTVSPSSKGAYTVINTVTDDGMSTNFIVHRRTQKNQEPLQELGF